MQPTEKFTLEKPADSSLTYSALWAEGKLARTKIPGSQLLRQFEMPYGYLLITDYDCPYEEAVSISFLNKDFTLRASRIIGAPYASAWFKDIEWLDDRNFQISLQHNNDYWRFRIQKWSIPLIRPLISMSHIQSTIPEPL